MFAPDYFGRPAYLAQSPQFYKQTLVGVFERVYEVGAGLPRRAARHRTAPGPVHVARRGASASSTDHRDVMAVLRETLAGMLGALRGIHRGSSGRAEASIPVIHFAEAPEMVGKATRRGPVGRARPRPRRTSAGSAEWAHARKHGSDFLFVEGYPMAKRLLLHPSRPGATCLLERIRPAVPRASNW